MEANTLNKYNSMYSEMRGRLKSILAITAKARTNTPLADSDCYILQMTPAIGMSEDRLKSVGKLFNFNLYVGTIISGKSEESRIFRRNKTTDKLIGYVSYRSSLRKVDSIGNNNLCPIRDMWFIVEQWPVVSIRDIDHVYKNPTVYIRTDTKPISVL